MMIVNENIGLFIQKSKSYLMHELSTFEERGQLRPSSSKMYEVKCHFIFMLIETPCR